MDRRTYLALASTAVVGATGMGSAPAMAQDDPVPTGTEIGGGEGYEDTVSPVDSDVVVSTGEELENALDARLGTIYIEDDAVIDLSARRITIPGDVTLASGRGRNGSSGALITADERASRLFQIFEEGVRITGLRFRGHHVGYYDPDGSVWSNDSLAIRAYADCKIDNCELYGWTHAGIGIGQHGSDPIDSDAHVHHCSIHGNMMEGLGYGVVVYRGDPLIEYNYFDENRHSIAGGGQEGCSYEARYNIQGSTNLLFGFEMHSPGGDRIDIHHNTFELVERRDGRTTPAVAVRGTPNDGASIENNWFFNPNDPGDDRYMDDSPVVQTQSNTSDSDWNDVTLSNNHFGEDEPASEIGHPRGSSNPNGSNSPETTQLRVYVREEGVEEHLEGATVEIEPHADTDMNGYDGPLTMETEEGTETEAGEEYAGSYALFEDLPVGLYDIHASHPEYEPGIYTDLELDVSGRQPPIALEPRDAIGRTITIVGQGTPARYELGVTGELESVEDEGTDYAIDDSMATGQVTDESVSFVFTGSIDHLDSDAPIGLLLEGEPEDTIPDGQVITFEGGTESDPTHYLFEVTDRVEQTDANDATIDDEDAIYGTTVAGILQGERDSYVIPADEEITGFIALGDLSVWIDDTEVDSGEVVSYFE